MPRFIQSIREIVDLFDAAVLDQWGVLHNGSVPYPHAADAIKALKEHDKHIVILSNSGKRASINLERIAEMGLPAEHVASVVTSGEALRDDLLAGRLIIGDKAPRTIFPICGKPGDAEVWRGDASSIQIADTYDDRVDCVMLMGLPDGSSPEAYDGMFRQMLRRDTPLICSNPDKTSPRAGGLVISPGALADRYAETGGRVVWYGKPHLPVYEAVMRCRPDIKPSRFMMVGDSLEHDIAGAQRAGFKTAWVRGGIHADAFDGASDVGQLASITKALAQKEGIEPPHFSLQSLA